MNNWNEELVSLLKIIPWIECINDGEENGKWWIKFRIELDNIIAWNIVQEFWHILNYLSIDERLPTLFYPISSPPYLNWWPKDYLWWIIENTDKDFTSKDCFNRLKWRLPDPINDIESWKV